MGSATQGFACLASALAFLLALAQHHPLKPLLIKAEAAGSVSATQAERRLQGPALSASPTPCWGQTQPPSSSAAGHASRDGGAGPGLVRREQPRSSGLAEPTAERGPAEGRPG